MRAKFFLLLMLAAAQSHAAEFEPHYQLGTQTLTLCSQTPMKKMLFNLGDVALYAKDCAIVTADTLTSQPVHLTFKYERAFDGDDFIESSDVLIKRNTAQDEYKAIQTELSAFNANYQAISDGERYDIGWSETTGLVLSKNNRQLSQSNSAELASIYFRIWFGKDPFSNAMKNALLEGALNR